MNDYIDAIYIGSVHKRFVGKHAKKLYALYPGVKVNIHKLDITDEFTPILPPQYNTGNLISKIASRWKPSKPCKCNKLQIFLNRIGPFNTLFNLLLVAKQIRKSSGWNSWWRYPIAIVIMYICIYEIVSIGVNEGYENIKILSGMG